MNSEHTKEKHILLIFNEISGVEKEELIDHLQHCPECMNDYIRLKEMTGLYDSLPVTEPPDEIVTKVIDQLKTDNKVNIKLGWLEKVNLVFKPKYRFALITGLVCIGVICFFLMPIFHQDRISNFSLEEKSDSLKNIHKPSFPISSGLGGQLKEKTPLSSISDLSPGTRKKNVFNKKHNKKVESETFYVLAGLVDSDLDKRLKNLDEKISELLVDLNNDFKINVVEE
jgi:hypothetical protein